MTTATIGNASTVPLVSIVICTYNQQNFIRETLDSVLAQTYPNIEIIVSDDGSSDETPNILREYASRYPDKIKPVFSPVNTGIPSNINRAMAQRAGEYVAWLDGDDLMMPTKIEKQVDVLLAHPEATGCYHDADVFDSDTGHSMGRMSELYNGSLELKQGHLKDWYKPRYYFLPSTIMARSEICPPQGYDWRLKHFSEGLYFVEAFRTGILLALNETLTRYRRHVKNLTNSSGMRNVSAEYELIALAILDARYPELRNLVKRQRASCLLTEAVKNHREGNFQRRNQILLNVAKDGYPLKAVAVFAAVKFMRFRAAQITSGQPYQRPGWVNRFARKFLE